MTAARIAVQFGGLDPVRLLDSTPVEWEIRVAASEVVQNDRREAGVDD